MVGKTVLFKSQLLTTDNKIKYLITDDNNQNIDYSNIIKEVTIYTNTLSKIIEITPNNTDSVVWSIENGLETVRITHNLNRNS